MTDINSGPVALGSGTPAARERPWDAIPDSWYFSYYRDVSKVGTDAEWPAFACLDSGNSFAVTLRTDGDHYQFLVKVTGVSGISRPSSAVDGCPVSE
jgi:hypothetical protein